MARGTSVGPSVKVKNEKEPAFKAESQDKGKRRARLDDDEEDADVEGDADPDGSGDEDAEGEAEQDEDEVAGSPRGNKRRRVNEEGESRPSSTPKWKEPKERIKTLPRDTDGYIPGSIVRIQLKNFVTYDFVEFRPGPYLNMILGPNGTGKSSIACAICLGLNWPPSVLGRASEINSFVKHGYDAGHIEIELKGKRGQGNLVIRRHLTATSKGSWFTVNGEKTQAKAVSAKMAELNVQVGNLCSFLPQDKVSEFAMMSPQQLLKETQRAAGDERLTAWHETLVNAGKEFKQVTESIEEDDSELQTLRTRNEIIERDVQRFKEREKIEHEIKLLNVLIPVERYRILRENFSLVKARQRALHEKVKKLKDKNEPAHAFLQQLDADCKESEKARDRIKKTTQGRFEDLKKRWQDSDKLEQEADEWILKLDNLKKEERDRIRRIKNTEQEIAKTKSMIEKHSEVKPEKIEDVQSDMRQLTMEHQDVVLRRGNVDDKLKINIDSRARSNAGLNQAHGELKRLDDVNVQKLQALARWDKDTHDVVVWLREHKHLFKMEVFEPPMLCLTVPNRNFVQAIEACFAGTQIKTFVAQCQEDVDTFNHWVNDTDKALGRRVRVTTWYRAGSSLPPPPMPTEQMRGLGFDGYAIDYVDCPQGLYWFLQRELNLHRTAIGLNPGRINVDQAMHAVANPETGGGASFILGTTMNIVSRSRYGRKAISNLTREIGPARNLGNSTIDPDVKRRIDAQIKDCREQISLLDEERKELDAENAKVMEEDKIFQKRQNEIKSRREAIKKHDGDGVKLASKLKRNEATLLELQQQPSADEERARLKKALLRISKRRVKIAKEYMDLARLIITEHTEATKKGIGYLQSNSNKEALQRLCDKKDAKYLAALAEFNKVDEEFRTIKGESKALLDESRAVINDAEPDLRDEYLAIEGARTAYKTGLATAEENGTTPPSAEGIDLRTLEDLHAELQTQQANLELNLATNPNVVKEYERRKLDIETLEKKIEGKQKKAEKIERNIKHARDNWQPALDKLVASIGQKFSAAFDRFGCAGEIRISEHEDYDKWAIDILVKFRDTEKLQLLTGQRQSGGERSLTTILYLLSLTEEARAPFSLVDEINQGMDQRAERTVHNSMVEVTCNPDSAQYFLITPKLLPDLKYHERMKILCVNNGEWLPEEPGLGNMMSMIDGFVQRRRQATNYQ